MLPDPLVRGGLRRAVGDRAPSSGLVVETSEGAQELFPRSQTGPDELRREAGAVLRLPEGVVINADDIDIEQTDDETMIINMGPQHPSTHGVLRLMIELDGETVLRTKPVIGYLHTGMEKTAEELTYVQGSTNVTRMDYLSPLHNELVLSLAVEALLGVEMPARSDWIRMLLVELNRMSSHLMWMATNGMDHASTSMMIYGFREREMILAFFEKTTGLRMNHNFIRPGGTAADLPDGWEDDVTVICDTVLPRLDEYDELLTGQPVFRQRSEGIGNLSAEEALALSLTGPLLRSTGVAVGPAPRPCRTSATTRSSSTSSSAPSATTSTGTRSASTRSASRSGSSARSSRRCRRATTGSRTRRSPRRPAAASTSRWRP